MSLKIHNPIEHIESGYKNIIHPEAKGNYPLLERCVAYVLPTAAAGVALYSDSTNAQAHWGNFSNIYQIPAAIGAYMATQFACTYIKSHIANMDKGIVKSLADFTVTQLDIVNDFLVLIPAYNILPKGHNFNKIFAFDVMPEMIKGAESDLKNWWNKEDYESEVAGRIYAGAIAGGISRNIASYLANKLAGSEEKLINSNQVDENKQASLNEVNINNQNEFIETVARSSLSAMTKKLLIGKEYQKGDMVKEFSENVVQNLLLKTQAIQSLEGALQLKDTIFENGATISGAICGVNLIQYCLNAIENPEISELDDADLISPTPIISDL